MKVMAAIALWCLFALLASVGMAMLMHILEH
jgi:hypothetical protein